MSEFADGYIVTNDSGRWNLIVDGEPSWKTMFGFRDESFRRVSPDVSMKLHNEGYGNLEYGFITPLRQAARKAREVRRNHPRNSTRYMGRPY